MCIRDRPEEWKVAKNLTNRHLRELVLLFTMEEVKSPPGSPEHLKRLKAGPKVKNVRLCTPEEALYTPVLARNQFVCRVV